LAESVQGITGNDLGVISCMVEGLTPAEASQQLGITEHEYEVARIRIKVSIERHNQLLRRVQFDFFGDTDHTRHSA
jgi:hypothetical protein